jgi:chaperonin cofactor prefoldin
LEDFERLETKIDTLEKEVIDIHERYLTVAETIREMQKYMVKIAQHQAIIADQISRWPYIAVDRKTSKLKKDKE